MLNFFGPVRPRSGTLRHCCLFKLTILFRRTVGYLSGDKSKLYGYTS